MQQQILVTGGNSGIGLEMVKAFVAAGHKVVIAARNQAKSQAAIDAIKQAQPEADLHCLALDLASHASIDQAAGEILQLLPQLDTVMLNAGSYITELRQDNNGLESMISTMHFGHFRLMQRLLPRLKEASSARVVVTSSIAHWCGKIDAASMRNPAAYHLVIRAYGSAKLANLIYARELARRVKGSNIRVNAFHPGAVATDLYREFSRPLQAIIDRIMITPDKGADTGIWLALDPAAARFHGNYLVNRKPAACRAISKNQQVAAQLWTLSEQLAGI